MRGFLRKLLMKGVVIAVPSKIVCCTVGKAGSKGGRLFDLPDQ